VAEEIDGQISFSTSLALQKDGKFKQRAHKIKVLLHCLNWYSFVTFLITFAAIWDWSSFKF
jgi:hypothetical protein